MWTRKGTKTPPNGSAAQAGRISVRNPGPPNTGVLPLGGGANTSAPAVPSSYVALDVSDNGQFVVGFVGRSGTSKAVIWKDGVKRSILLEDFLKQRGVTIPDGWHLSVANVISADGCTIYGWGFNPDHFVEMYKVVLN